MKQSAKKTPRSSFSAASKEELKSWVTRYPWFTAARLQLARCHGASDPTLAWLAADRQFVESELAIDAEALLHLSSEDLIDRFLREKELRIVAEAGEPDSEIAIEAELEDEDDLVSEDLAEVYLNQGLKQQALEIYRRLSLLNPEKSIYFAEIIERIETSN